MKYTLLIPLLVFCKSFAFGQTESEVFRRTKLQDRALGGAETENLLLNTSFPKLLTHTTNSVVYGFIGDNYQRLRIRFISVKQSEVANSYTVYGKSMVKGNVCEFRGSVNIANTRKYKVSSYGVDDKYKNAGLKGQFIIIGEIGRAHV